MESKNYRYQYPNNLAQKPRIALWTLQELVLLAILTLVLMTFAIRLGFAGFALCIIAGTGLLSAHFGDSDRSVFDYLKTMLLYLKNPQVWEYDPSFEMSTHIEKKDSVRKKDSRKKNRGWLITAVILLAGFAALIILSKMKGR